MARQRRTSTDLAAALQLSQSTASRLMNGDQPLDLDRVSVIADWLGVSPTLLITAAA